MIQRAKTAIRSLSAKPVRNLILLSVFGILTGCAALTFVNDGRAYKDCRDNNHDEAKCSAYSACLAKGGSSEAICRMSHVGIVSPFGSDNLRGLGLDYEGRARAANEACRRDGFGVGTCFEFADCYGFGETGDQCFARHISATGTPSGACSAL